MGARKVAFTKEHYRALCHLDSEGVGDERPHWVGTALRDLIARMVEARSPSQPLPVEAEPKTLSVQAFLDALGEVFQPHQMAWATTKGSYARMAVQLRNSGWTRDDVVTLARHVKTWWTRGPVNVHTLLGPKGHEWLAIARARAVPAPEAVPAVHSLFPDEEGDE